MYLSLSTQRSKVNGRNHLSWKKDPGDERLTLMAGESYILVSFIMGSPKPRNLSTTGDIKWMSLPLKAKMKP